jgi:glycosyltransferase involved in cell wall biosynthesis
MSEPLVSICLPNLNTFRFLEERIDTIFGQTHDNWEMIVSDNFSDDGSWEFFQNLARKDQRIAIEQAPREGMYANWNNCVRRARGKYFYIATSDDTMASDCLEKLVAALEQHTECDLAHCPVILVDETGARLTDQSWPECTVFGDGIGELVHKPHVRRAPYDGLLHLVGRHVTISFTQLLIRRSLFSRTGPFQSKWGSISDFNWEMKAGLVANMIHVPDTWATWRIHPTGASTSIDVHTVEHYRKFEEMVQDAVSACEAYLPPEIVAGLKSGLLDRAAKMRTYYANLRQRRNTMDRRLFQLSELFAGSAAARSQVIGRLFGRPKWPDIAPTEIRLWLEARGHRPILASTG